MKYISILFFCILCGCLNNIENQINLEPKLKKIKNEDSIKKEEMQSVSKIEENIEITIDTFYLDKIKIFIYEKWDFNLGDEGHIENYICSKYDTLNIREYFKTRSSNFRSNLNILRPEKKNNTNFIKLGIWFEGSAGRNAPYLVMRIKIQNKLFKVIELYEFDPETKTKYYY